MVFQMSYDVQHYSKVCFQVSDELIRVAILWHELWHEGLEEASRLYFSEGNVKGMLGALEPLHQMMERGPQTLKETSFNQVQLKDQICRCVVFWKVTASVVFVQFLPICLLVCLSVGQFEVQFDVMSVDCNFFIRLVVVMCFCSFLSGIWSRSDGSPGMVQKVSTIRKCQRSDTGLGFVLLGFQANLQTTPTGTAKTLQSTRAHPVA